MNFTPSEVKLARPFHNGLFSFRCLICRFTLDLLNVVDALVGGLLLGTYLLFLLCSHRRDLLGRILRQRRVVWLRGSITLLVASVQRVIKGMNTRSNAVLVLDSSTQHLSLSIKRVQALERKWQR